jgi:hypothetical protein
MREVLLHSNRGEIDQLELGAARLRPSRRRALRA